MDNKINYRNLIISVSFFVAIALFYLFAVPYQIGFKEQISLFLPDASRIAIYLEKPAFVSVFLGDFLSMFYYSNVAGALISVFLLVLLWWGLKTALHSIGAGNESSILALIPVSFEAMYLIYLNYPISSTIGFILSTWMFVLLSKIKKDRLYFILSAISIPLFYCLAGGYVIVWIILFCFFTRDKIKISGFIAIADIILILIIGKFYNQTMIQSLLFPVVLNYILPQSAYFLFTPISVFVILFISVWNIKPLFKTILTGVIVLFSFGLSFWGTNYKEMEYSVEIGTHAYKNEWEKVNAMSINNETNNIFGIYYRNLCFAREGRLADELLKYPQSLSDGLFMDIVQGTGYLNIMYYIDQLLLVGDISQATDCALLGQTIMPGHYSTRMLRYLSEIAIATGDYNVADKYLDLLRDSYFHKGWASEMKQVLHSDSIPDNIRRMRIAARSPEDVLFDQNDWEKSLRVKAQFNGYNVVAIDYLLCAYLLGKNFNTFKGLYDKYYLNKIDRVITVPTIYQEALLSPVTDEKSLNETIEKYHISASVAERFVNFMNDQIQSNGTIGSMTKYSGTYWFYVISTKVNQDSEE